MRGQNYDIHGIWLHLRVLIFSIMRLFLNDSEFIETQHGEDLSIELTKEDANPRAWYVDYPK